jgi:hypothetical protein
MSNAGFGHKASRKVLPCQVLTSIPIKSETCNCNSAALIRTQKTENAHAYIRSYILYYNLALANQSLFCGPQAFVSFKSIYL